MNAAELCTRGFLVYISARRGAFVVWYSGERDSGVKWEKTSVRPSRSTLLDLITHNWHCLSHSLIQVAPTSIIEFAQCELHLQLSRIP
jgi:hypothetical protein